MKVIKQGFLNKSHEAWVDEQLKAHENLLPCWVQSIRVIQVACPESMTGTAASMEMLLEYRTATLRLYDMFWTEPEDQWVIMLRHELAHLYTASMVHWTLDHIIPLFDEPVREVLDREFQRRMEECTQDLALAIDRVLG